MEDCLAEDWLMEDRLYGLKYDTSESFQRKVCDALNGGRLGTTFRVTLKGSSKDQCWKDVSEWLTGVFPQLKLIHENDIPSPYKLVAVSCDELREEVEATFELCLRAYCLPPGEAAVRKCELPCAFVGLATEQLPYSALMHSLQSCDGVFILPKLEFSVVNNASSPNFLCLSDNPYLDEDFVNKCGRVAIATLLNSGDKSQPRSVLFDFSANLSAADPIHWVAQGFFAHDTTVRTVLDSFESWLPTGVVFPPSAGVFSVRTIQRLRDENVEYANHDGAIATRPITLGTAADLFQKDPLMWPVEVCGNLRFALPPNADRTGSRLCQPSEVKFLPRVSFSITFTPASVAGAETHRQLHSLVFPTPSAASHPLRIWQRVRGVPTEVLSSVSNPLFVRVLVHNRVPNEAVRSLQTLLSFDACVEAGNTAQRECALAVVRARGRSELVLVCVEVDPWQYVEACVWHNTTRRRCRRIIVHSDPTISWQSVTISPFDVDGVCASHDLVAALTRLRGDASITFSLPTGLRRFDTSVGVQLGPKYAAAISLFLSGKRSDMALPVDVICKETISREIERLLIDEVERRAYKSKVQAIPVHKLYRGCGATTMLNRLEHHWSRSRERFGIRVLESALVDDVVSAVTRADQSLDPSYNAIILLADANVKGEVLYQRLKQTYSGARRVQLVCIQQVLPGDPIPKGLCISPFLSATEMRELCTLYKRYFPVSTDALQQLEDNARTPYDRHLFAVALTAIRQEFQPVHDYVQTVYDRTDEESRKGMLALAVICLFGKRHRALPVLPPTVAGFGSSGPLVTSTAAHELLVWSEDGERATFWHVWLAWSWLVCSGVHFHTQRVLLSVVNNQKLLDAVRTTIMLLKWKFPMVFWAEIVRDIAVRREATQPFSLMVTMLYKSQVAGPKGLEFCTMMTALVQDDPVLCAHLLLLESRIALMLEKDVGLAKRKAAEALQAAQQLCLEKTKLLVFETAYAHCLAEEEPEKATLAFESLLEKDHRTAGAAVYCAKKWLERCQTRKVSTTAAQEWLDMWTEKHDDCFECATIASSFHWEQLMLSR